MSLNTPVAGKFVNFHTTKGQWYYWHLQYLITKLQHDCYKHRWTGVFWDCSVSDIILLLSLSLSRRLPLTKVCFQRYLLCNNETRRLWPWPAMINTIINSFYLSIYDSFFFRVKKVISSQRREDQQHGRRGVTCKPALQLTLFFLFV